MSRLHRFYVGNDIELTHDFWLHDERLLHQWSKVLRFKAGQDIILFNDAHERLYKIVEMPINEAHLQHVTDLVRKVPSQNVYLFWSLLKKDKNDWVLQKCTELGVKHFVPLLADRSEKTGFNIERAQKIIIEAAEQCGRSDIPTVIEPQHVEKALLHYKDAVTLYVCEQSDQETSQSSQHEHDKKIGVLIGPEGGWSDREKSVFTDSGIEHINIHDFTLRAETACVTAVAKLLQ